MVSLEDFNKNNDIFLKGYNGEKALDCYYEDDLIYACWNSGRIKAKADGKNIVIKKEASIKINTDYTIRLNYQRIPDCY